MRKKIAILTKKGSLSNEPKDNSDLNIFNLEDDKVVEFEKIKLGGDEYKHFSSILVNNNINLIYMGSVNNELRSNLTELGINIKCKNEWKNDNFINHFVFD